MNFAFFIHSLASDWNHGNAHFVRGVLSELLARGHSVTTHEQRDNWSRYHLRRDHGEAAVKAYLEHYPEFRGIDCDYDYGATDTFADPDFADVDLAAEVLDLPRRLSGVDVVVVHEWTPPGVVAALGRYRQQHDDFVLLFHDTHHRAVSEPEKMAKFDLTGYDGVLAFGEVLQRAYETRNIVPQVWTWHEAADTKRFHPIEAERTGDLVWVGNWGDGERTAELHEFLLNPCRELNLSACVHGVRYGEPAKAALAESGIEYGGYLPNVKGPEVFSRHKLTVHVPRRFYVTHLAGIPTIRPFEALACGLPLVCSPWDDAEHLFTPGRDYLVANNGGEMRAKLKHLLDHPDAAAEQAAHGLETVLARHTCAHRVDELLAALDSVPAALSA